MNEKILEKKLREKIKNRDGMALKFVPTFYKGAPDRIVLLPGGKTVWVELKTTGQKLRPIQEVRKKELENLGYKVFVVDSQETLDDFLRKVDEDAI